MSEFGQERSFEAAMENFRSAVRKQTLTSPRRLIKDGTTYLIFEPVDFIALLVALVPKPRVNLRRFHGTEMKASNLAAQD